MKLVIAKALIEVVKTRGEDPKENILGLDIKFKAEVKPEVLDEFDAQIRPRLFDDQGAPAIPDLGVCHWKPGYENGDMNIGGNKIADTKVLNITFEPKPGGMVEIRGWARCTPDKELTGEISFLLKQQVRLSFLKMTQIPLIKAGAEDNPEGDEPPDGGQPGLPAIEPLIGKDGKTEDERRAARTKH